MTRADARASCPNSLLASAPRARSRAPCAAMGDSVEEEAPGAAAPSPAAAAREQQAPAQRTLEAELFGEDGDESEEEQGRAGGDGDDGDAAALATTRSQRAKSTSELKQRLQL